MDDAESNIMVGQPRHQGLEEGDGVLLDGQRRQAVGDDDGQVVAAGLGLASPQQGLARGVVEAAAQVLSLIHI